MKYKTSGEQNPITTTIIIQKRTVNLKEKKKERKEVTERA